MRTNFGFRPASVAQQEVARKFFSLNKASAPSRQQIRLASFNPLIGRLILDNFFIKTINGVKTWCGYKIIVFRDGEIAYDREFVVQRINGVLELVRDNIEEIAA